MALAVHPGLRGCWRSFGMLITGLAARTRLAAKRSIADRQSTRDARMRVNPSELRSATARQSATVSGA